MNNSILVSNDFGKSWKEVQLSVGSLQGLSVVGNKTFMVCSVAASVSRIFSTTTPHLAATWQQVATLKAALYQFVEIKGSVFTFSLVNPGANVQSVIFEAPLTNLSDWSVVRTNFPSDAAMFQLASNGTAAVIVGAEGTFGFGGTMDGIASYSGNAGKSWNQGVYFSSGGLHAWLTGVVWHANCQCWFAFGMASLSNLFRSNDGVNWQIISPSTSYAFSDIVSVDDSLIAADSSLMFSVDDGVNFVPSYVQ